MRRKERAITDFSEIKKIISRNNSAVISMVDGMTPYGVMINYAPVFDGEKLRLIFHGANGGRKIDCLKKNPSVSIFINDTDKMQIVSAGAQSAHWTTLYQSVIISGKVRFASGLPEKRQMATEFMRHYTDGEINLPDAALNVSSFFEVRAENISGKHNLQENKL